MTGFANHRPETSGYCQTTVTLANTCLTKTQSATVWKTIADTLEVGEEAAAVFACESVPEDGLDDVGEDDLIFVELGGLAGQFGVI